MNHHHLVRRTIATAVLSLLTLSSAFAAGHRDITYRVTITNLTAGQPFTPPVVALHNSRTQIFSIGTSASEGVRSIAENGNSGPLLNALFSDANVGEVYEASAPLVPANNPGGTGFDSSVSFTVTAGRNVRRISFASMLICTNDGFTGINSVRLPRYKKTVLARAYETRTEENTEDFADIVPPCQGLIGVASDDSGTGASNPELAENGVVIPHAGIVGDNDLQSRVHDWADPVAKIVIERVYNYQR